MSTGYVKIEQDADVQMEPMESQEQYAQMPQVATPQVPQYSNQPNFTTLDERIEYNLRARWFWGMPWAQDETVDCCQCCPLRSGVLTWMAISMIWLLVDLIFTIVRLSITGWGGYGIILTLELFGAIFLSLGIYGAWKYKFSLVKLYSTIMFIVAFIEFGGIVTIYWGSYYVLGFFYLCDVLLRIYLAWRAYTLANIYKRCEIEHFRANGLISAV